MHLQFATTADRVHRQEIGGEGGIRPQGCGYRTTVFETAPRANTQPTYRRRRHDLKAKKLIGQEGAGALQFSDEFIGDGAALFRACAGHQLEGIVSKLASSRYRSGRSRSWLKTKCFMESELTLIGIDRDRTTGAARALLAKTDCSNLIYAGAAFLTLGEATT